MARHAPDAELATSSSERVTSTPAPESAAALPVRAVVSLSGGVDSMVLACILSRLGAGRWRVAGVHIDYGNRPESGAEADHVRAWCAAQGIEFRLRRITEVRRAISGRDEYERESRRIRYDFYSSCLAEFSLAAGVCVGHHRGDVQENVITNLLKGTSLLGISGMSEVSTVNGVPVWCGGRCAGGTLRVRAERVHLPPPGGPSCRGTRTSSSRSRIATACHTSGAWRGALCRLLAGWQPVLMSIRCIDARLS